MVSKAHALELGRFSTGTNFHSEVLRGNEAFVLTPGVEKVSEPGNLVPRNIFELRVLQKIFQKIFQHFELTLLLNLQVTTILLSLHCIHTNISSF